MSEIIVRGLSNCPKCNTELAPPRIVKGGNYQMPLLADPIISDELESLRDVYRSTKNLLQLSDDVQSSIKYNQFFNMSPFIELTKRKIKEYESKFGGEE